MASKKSAPARLRRTFQYPTDDSATSSNNNSPDVMDEEEQESLIVNLAAQDARRNGQFRHALFALPALASVPYFIELLALSRGGGGGASSSSHAPALLPVLALTSLASTTFMLWRLPPAETGIAALDAWCGSQRRGSDGDVDPSDPSYLLDDDDGSPAGPSTSVSGSRRLQGGPRRPSAPGGGLLAYGDSSHHHHHHHHPHPQGPYRSPLEMWLPYLNAALCLLVVLMGLVSGSDAAWGRRALVGIGNLPAAVFAVVLLAKTVMAGVDPERELGELRYGYKGV